MVKIGQLKRGEEFLWNGENYKVGWYLNNGYVMCLNMARNKRYRFYIDTEVSQLKGTE